jgi:hypothetical protein
VHHLVGDCDHPRPLDDTVPVAIDHTQHRTCNTTGNTTFVQREVGRPVEDNRPHVGNGIRQYLGNSRARWEGDELVVETTNPTDQTAVGVNGNGVRHSPRMMITERFKRVAGDILQYQMTFDDPATYEQPFTISMPLTPLDGGRLLPYDCHEGNMAIVQSLGAERAEDKALAEGLARGIVRPRRAVQDGAGVGAALPPGRGRGAGPGAGNP